MQFGSERLYIYIYTLSLTQYTYNYTAFTWTIPFPSPPGASCALGAQPLALSAEQTWHVVPLLQQ